MPKTSSDKKVVLAGGCFDVLHPGHIIFLEKAKKIGDYLVVLLESDQKVRLIKGAGRPIHSQKDRARILKAVRFVDEVVMLPYLESDKAYDEVVNRIKPDIIATTSGDKNLHHYQRSAKAAKAKLIFVTKLIGDYSTSRILNHRK